MDHTSLQHSTKKEHLKQQELLTQYIFDSRRKFQLSQKVARKGLENSGIRFINKFEDQKK